MERIALTVILAAASTLAGRAISSGMQRRVKILDRLIHGLSLFRISAICRCVPLKYALKDADVPIMSCVADMLEESPSVSDAWHCVSMNACKRGNDWDCLAQEELMELDRLFSNLGYTSGDAMDTEISASIATLELIRNKALEQAVTTGRLYTSIGCLTGLAVAVMLI